MHKLYYQPEGFWFGDCMPFGKGDEFYLFHQRDNRNPGPFGEPFGWCLATTKDFVHYIDKGTAIPRGSDTDQDQFIYAGSVFEDKEHTYHAFYTGYNREFPKLGKASQVLMHATSKDLLHWEKTEEALTFTPQPGYDKDDWRDPFVIYEEDKDRYRLILGARKLNGQKRINGCTVQFFSKDLKEWEFGGQFWAPELYTMHEMPDLFRIGDWWYHIVTEYSDKSKMIYRMSRSIEGPWIAPYDDAFDGRAYYAGRTFLLNGERIVFGWVPTKVDCDDKNQFEWGGTFMPHKIVQRADGTLGCLPVPGILKAFINGQQIQPCTVKGEGKRTEKILHGDTSDLFKFECNLEYKEGSRYASINFYENEETGDEYSFKLLFQEDRIVFDVTPNQPWFQCMNIGLERPFRFESGKKYHITLIVDDTIATLYVDDVALNSRFYSKFGTALSISAVDGEVSVSAASVSTDIQM